jgi:hypothetical protein
MNILTGRNFVDVLALQYENQWLLRPGDLLRALQSFLVGGEGIEIVVSVILVWRSSLRVTPDSIL